MIAAAMRESSDRVGGGGVAFSGRVRRRRRTMYMFYKSYDITRIHEARALAGQKHSKVESASRLAVSSHATKRSELILFRGAIAHKAARARDR